MVLTSFRLVRPRYQAPQAELLERIAQVHARAECALSAGRQSFDRDAFLDRFRRLASHVCCGPDQIETRGFTIGEAPATADEPPLFDVERSPRGAGTAARNAVFTREIEPVFSRLYADQALPPHDLVHVTCTGYVSPSAAQRLVSAKGWGGQTRVTHAYHMGCYAAVPALRIALGCALQNLEHEDDPRVDVVHTELCTIHFDPSAHTAEQLVVQSLFADGSARYTLRRDAGGAPGFRVLALHEVIAEGTPDHMQWLLGDHGMTMTLSRDVPERVGGAIRPFVGALFARAGLDAAAEKSRCVFAVHPGGPRIIDQVRDVLELEEWQVAAARRVLRHHGNMSSATLPHVWSALLGDASCAPGTLVASFAFGPGLTVSGALFRRV